jgi:opacity protein-like surface antigen
MKKILLKTSLFLAIANTNLVAADFIQNQYYGGIGVGLEDFSTYSSYDPGATIVLNGGKPIIKLGPGTIGAEGEFTYTALPLNYNRSQIDWDLSIMTLAAYATYTFEHSDKLYTKAKLGIVQRNYSWDYNGNNNNSDFDYNEVGVGAGIGIGYKLNNKLRVYSDLILLDTSDLKQLNFGLQMNF